MIQAKLIKLGKYLATKRHQEFEWGRNDCNTFVMEMHDAVHDTDVLKQIYEKYTTMRTAMIFSKRVIGTAEDKLVELGYTKRIKATSGDVLLQDGKFYTTAWIVLDKIAYSMHEQHGCMMVETRALDNYTVWRM